jgi:FkbM family methyltransferase
MCSSLSDVDEETQRKDWPGGCAETKYKIKVPAVRLESIVDRLPIRRVDFIKIDAQGNDFDVVRPAFVRGEVSKPRMLTELYFCSIDSDQITWPPLESCVHDRYGNSG